MLYRGIGRAGGLMIEGDWDKSRQEDSSQAELEVQLPRHYFPPVFSPPSPSL